MTHDLPRFSHPFITGDSRFRFGAEMISPPSRLHSLLLPGGTPPAFDISANYAVVRSYTLAASLPVSSAHRSECGTGARQALVTQPAVEALDMAILHRPPRLNVHQSDLPLLGPAQHS